jgi:hypothetical protein
VPEALLVPITTVLLAGTDTYTLPAVAAVIDPSAT